ncbi:MAG: amidohydrolase [Bacteroidales bacterium]
MKVSIVQTDIAWENSDKNLEELSEKLKFLKQETDLIVLPEMFTTGFSMNPEKLAENPNGITQQWMKNISKELHTAVLGSLIIKEKGNYYNRLICQLPDSKYYTYDKRHLFRMGEENDHYTAGKEKVIFKYKGWRIRPLICYDLRFPVWSRNRNDYDMLVYVANWPESRNHVWKNLLIARALENQVYVVGVNRIGTDGQQLSYSGDSMIIDPKGNLLSETVPYKQFIDTKELSLESLNAFRKKFPVANDADDFELKIY